jgi:hypothetical protein
MAASGPAACIESHVEAPAAAQPRATWIAAAGAGSSTVSLPVLLRQLEVEPDAAALAIAPCIARRPYRRAARRSFATASDTGRTSSAPRARLLSDQTHAERSYYLGSVRKLVEGLEARLDGSPLRDLKMIPIIEGAWHGPAPSGLRSTALYSSSGSRGCLRRMKSPNIGAVYAYTPWSSR